jgi:hypothetical protein
VEGCPRGKIPDLMRIDEGEQGTELAVTSRPTVGHARSELGPKAFAIMELGEVSLGRNNAFSSGSA